MAFYMDPKKFKFLYIIPAFILMLLAIAASYLRHPNIAAGLIVLGSAIILVGSFIFAHLYRIEQQKKDLD